MADNLVIVESPTKAKTISKFLGSKYKVESSFGHVRDLPKSKLSVDTKNNFQPTYITIPKAKKRVTELKKLVKKAKTIILAPDEDREGEAIAWHLTKALELDPAKTKRIVFHEITKKAIEEALKNPRSLNSNLIDAQQARRILDRLVGYELSPLLWKKIYRGLSAGRVQSVALRLIVEKEKERQNFKPQEYWTLETIFRKSIPTSQDQSSNRNVGEKSQIFSALLIKINEKNTPELGLPNRKSTEEIVGDLKNGTYQVTGIKIQEVKRNPQAPFTTSSLVTEAASRLNFSTAQTMRIAQELYEGIDLGKKGQEGLITYMRTDSLNLSEEFLNKAQKFITSTYGKEYWAGSPRRFKTKSKAAQEAHEAVRPTEAINSPESIKKFLDARQFKLYDLIWRRAVASQMKEAQILQTTVEIKGQGQKKDYLFKATGSQVKFDGFLKLYPQRTSSETIPELEKNETLNLVKLSSQQHFTQPPARFSEGTLVKTLEKFGIGRPSTYVPIMITIQSRNYVRKDQNRRLYPTDVGVLVNDLLVKHFPEIVDIGFTAQLEDKLDKIAHGELSWTKTLDEFYWPFHENLENKEKEISKRELITESSDEICEKCNKPMVIKLGRFGKFLACSGYPDCKNTKGILNTIDLKCPKCIEGEVIERTTKKGRTFYGCSRYPDCDFATWQKPNGQKCPACQEALVETPSGIVKCSKCSWKEQKDNLK